MIKTKIDQFLWSPPSSVSVSIFDMTHQPDHCMNTTIDEDNIHLQHYWGATTHTYDRSDLIWAPEEGEGAIIYVAGWL